MKNLALGQFGQLPLFMSPGDIKHNFAPNEADVEEHVYSDGFEDDPEGTMWRGKSEEAYDEGLTHSVRRSGVRTPIHVDLDQKSIVDGHHRVQASEDARHDFIPVEFDGRPSRQHAGRAR